MANYCRAVTKSLRGTLSYFCAERYTLGRKGGGRANSKAWYSVRFSFHAACLASMFHTVLVPKNWRRPYSYISLLSGQRRSNSSHLFFVALRRTAFISHHTSTYISHSLAASFYLSKWRRLPANGVYTHPVFPFSWRRPYSSYSMVYIQYSPSISGFSSSLPGIFHVLLPFTTT